MSKKLHNAKKAVDLIFDNLQDSDFTVEHGYACVKALREDYRRPMIVDVFEVFKGRYMNSAEEDELTELLDAD